MLTYQLVQPTFAILKLSSLFGANRLDVSVSSGKLKPKDFRVLLRIHYALSVLKLIQFLISLNHLSYSLDQGSKCIQNAVVVAAMTCVVIVALVWSLELDKKLCDVIILLSPWRRDEQSDYDDCCEHFGIKVGASHAQKTSFWRKQFYRLVFLYCTVVSSLRATYNDLGRLLPTFSVHDMLTFIVPIAITSFAPVFSFCVIIGEPEDALFVSLLNPAWKTFGVLHVAAVLLDLIVVSFVVMSLELGFFTTCATFAAYIREMKNLEEKLRCSHQRIMSSRSMKAMWLDIRRLAIIFNIGNYVGSNCFFSGKILTFTCSVLGTFYILRFGCPDVLSYGIALLAIQAIMFYVFCLGNAYVITETMNDVLQNVKLMSQCYYGSSRRELKQRVRSVRPMALMEGDFREISNDTTPEFFDFYVNQVIALVLTF